jgi:hypothetical protein
VRRSIASKTTAAWSKLGTPCGGEIAADVASCDLSGWTSNTPSGPLRLAPGFTLVALVVLTLGIGARVTTFSVVDAVVLRGLPFEDEARLFRIAESPRGGEARGGAVAPQNYRAWKAQQGGVFDDLAAIGRTAFKPSGADYRDLRVSGVTASLFSVLRPRMVIGAPFSTANEAEGRHRVLVISEGVWRRRFGADPEILGRTIVAPDGPWQIVGVVAAGFGYPTPDDGLDAVWAPYVVPGISANVAPRTCTT